jgi:hypothetical protein
MKISLSPLLLFILLTMMSLYISCKNDKDDEPEICDTTDMSYSNDIAPIIESNCSSGCHNGSNPASGFLLSSYDDLKLKVDEGRLLGAIKRQPGFSAMPKDRNPLSNCNISKIEAWVLQGAINN